MPQLTWPHHAICWQSHPVSLLSAPPASVAPPAGDQQAFHGTTYERAGGDPRIRPVFPARGGPGWRRPVVTPADRIPTSTQPAGCLAVATGAALG